MKGESGTKTNLNVQVIACVRHADLDRWSVWYDFQEFNIKQKSLVYQPLVPQYKIQSSLALWNTLALHLRKDSRKFNTSISKRTQILPKTLLVLGRSCCNHSQDILVPAALWPCNTVKQIVKFAFNYLFSIPLSAMLTLCMYTTCRYCNPSFVIKVKRKFH